MGLGFTEEQATKIMLAMDEALVNVIRHAYGGAHDKPIFIDMRGTEDNGRIGLRVLIRDEGRKVDPAKIRSRDLDDIRPGGLGVHLMKSIMDVVEFTPQDRGMALEMIKYLD